MGIHVLRRAAELGDGYVLAPERFDPRRNVEVGATRCLADIADVVTENVRAQALANAVLVLDTTHAYEGFVVLRHAPVAPAHLGGAKRKLLPGDVIVSRLRPYLRQIAYVDEALFQLAPGGNDVCASTEFYVIRGKPGLEAAALVPFLLATPVQAALAAGQEGGHHPRFSRELLAALRVPDRFLAEAPALARQVRELAAAMRDALNGCRALVTSLEARITD